MTVVQWSITHKNGSHDKGGPQNGFLEKVGHLAQPADPPPHRKLGRQKKKKKFNVFFAF